MGFKENILKKIRIDRLAQQVMDSIGSYDSGKKIDKKIMRQLLKEAAYEYKKRRDLDLYIKQEASGPEDQAAELGDVLFAMVNLARWYAVDAESALRWANTRFKKRFGFIEATAKRQGRELREMSLNEMDALWNQAKGM